MIYGSVCSGIEAATVAWHPLGWKPAWFSEIEPFPCKVLKNHYPHVPNLGNMLLLTQNKTFNERTIDLLVGGTPCQSFSIAGLRGGLADDRGNLALEFCRLLIAKQPRWFVWENVPGAFSSFSNETTGSDLVGTGYENGRDITETSDFAAILTAFRECGYSCAYRVLDAQYFGVPQRRRRIFVVGYFGNDWRPPAAVLFESNRVQRHSKKSRKTGEEIAGTLIKRAKGRSPGIDEAAAGQIIVGTLDARTKGGGFPGSDGAMNGHVLAFGGNNTSSSIDVATALKNGNRKLDFESETFIVNAFMPGQGSAAGSIAFGDVSPTLKSSSSGTNMVPALLAYPFNQISSPNNRSNPTEGDPAPTLTVRDYSPLIVPQVRRLTPLECERLQGFTDNYTKIPGSSDTSRYEAIGNSMAVPVMYWIGKRIDIIDKFLNK